MAALNSFISFSILALGILDGFKALKPSSRSKISTRDPSTTNPLSNLGQSTSESVRIVRSSNDGHPNKMKDQRQRVGSSERRVELRSQLTILLIWAVWRRLETILDNTIGWVLPFYETFKTVFLLWFLTSRTSGSSRIFYNLIIPLIKPYETLLDTITIQTSNLTALFIFLLSLPIARLTASLKNDLKPWVSRWIDWIRGNDGESFNSSNLVPDVSSNNKGSKGGNDGDGSGGSLGSTTRVGGEKGQIDVKARLSVKVTNPQPRKPSSSLQASSRLRTASSSATLNSNKGLKKPTLPQEERRRTTSLSNSTAIATAEKLRSIPTPPIGFGNSNAQDQPSSSSKDVGQNNEFRAFAFIPGQAPPRGPLLEPAILAVPSACSSSSSSSSGPISPRPPGAFGSNLRLDTNSQSNSSSFSSRGAFVPTSKSPFRIFADPPLKDSSSTSRSSINKTNGSESILTDRVEEMEERNHDETISSDNQNSTSKTKNSSSSSSSQMKKIYNGKSTKNGKDLSSSSSILRRGGGKNSIKQTTPSSSNIQSKLPSKAKGKEKEIKSNLPKSTSSIKSRSRSVTPAEIDQEKSSSSSTSSEEEVEIDSIDQNLTPRKRKSKTTITYSPASKKLRSREITSSNKEIGGSRSEVEKSKKVGNGNVKGKVKGSETLKAGQTVKARGGKTSVPINKVNEKKEVVESNGEAKGNVNIRGSESSSRGRGSVRARRGRGGIANRGKT